MVYQKQNWVDGVSVANAARLNHMEDGIASGGQAPYQFRPEDYGAKRDGVTDDTSAVQQAINAAFAYAQTNGGHYGEILLSPGVYLIAGPYQQGGATKANAQLTIPIQAETDPKIHLCFKGVDGPGLMFWRETQGPRYGAVLRSTGAGGNKDATYGEYAVLGTINAAQGAGADDGSGAALYNNILVILDGLQVVVPNPANQMGIDLQGAAAFWCKDASVMSDAHPSYTDPNVGSVPAGVFQGSSNSSAIGLRTPKTMNNLVCVIDKYSSEGMYIGLWMEEHVTVDFYSAIYCNVAVKALSSAHWMMIKRASVEHCGIFLDMSDASIDVLQMDVEVGYGEWATDKWVLANSSSMGSVRVTNYGDVNAVNPLGAGPFSDCTATGAKFVKIYDMRMPTGFRSDAPAVPASGTAVVNPYWRDIMIYLAGGTVSDVSIDGQSTGVTSGGILLPTGKPITLTYTVAPTWKWFITGTSF